MTKKNLFLALLVVSLAALSLYLNRHRFQKDELRVSSRSVPARGQLQRRTQNQKSATNPVVFLLDRRTQLTSVKVIPLSDIRTNKYPHPIWELVTESNSVPLKDFAYGVNIRGMKPSVPGARPEPLQPGIEYRVCVEAEGQKAEHDFTPVVRAQ
jgi:hypothetical protein